MRSEIVMARKRTRNAEIERIVDDVLQQHRITHPPVPIELIARSLGAELRYHPYDGELSGMLFQDGSRTVIGVNSLHHPNRQRFTIAHECGHMFLHRSQEMFIDRGSIRFNRDAKSAEGSDVHEMDANQFAAEILMPRKFLERDVAEMSTDIEDEAAIIELAKKYRVSQQALLWRINRLFDAT
jgi:Zn-dependent peptidase ImmA (M78 family)